MRKRKNRFLLGIYILVVIINVLAWYSGGFGDGIRQSVFCVTQYIQGHLSSLFPFSIGEFLLIIAAVLAVGAFVLSVVLLMEWMRGILRGRRIACRNSEGETVRGEKSKIVRFACRYFYALLWIVGIVSAIMSMNCFALYHCSSFQENYMPGGEREYHVRELALVRDHVVRQCNELAEIMERDEDGYIVYDGDIGQRATVEMERLGEEYPLLSGYYPVPKKFTFSGFFSQQYIMGYYFPFSMEANYNGTMYIANAPSTVCHELSHVKGFIYEDDANFIGYLACISSDDAFFRYSGYLSVLDYLNRDLYESLGRSREAYLSHEVCSPLVESDNIFLTRQAWEEVESNAVIDTEIVKQVSHSFLETNLQVNGIEEGIASYGDVVERLLVYYDGELY